MVYTADTHTKVLLSSQAQWAKQKRIERSPTFPIISVNTVEHPQIPMIDWGSDKPPNGHKEDHAGNELPYPLAIVVNATRS